MARLATIVALALVAAALATGADAGEPGGTQPELPGGRCMHVPETWVIAGYHGSLSNAVYPTAATSPPPTCAVCSAYTCGGSSAAGYRLTTVSTTIYSQPCASASVVKTVPRCTKVRGRGLWRSRPPVAEGREHGIPDRSERRTPARPHLPCMQALVMSASLLFAFRYRCITLAPPRWPPTALTTRTTSAGCV